jgi:hypothetical protein
VNTGDFVESCTAIAENADGAFEILHWRTTAVERAAANHVKALPAPRAVAA